VADIRAASPFAGGITLGVAGQTSAVIVISEKLAAALALYFAVVLGLSLVIIVVVFRSLRMIPLRRCPRDAPAALAYRGRQARAAATR
jgi:hypothetical protein